MATVFVIGAGPAGLFAAQKIALAGHETVVFNRDVKPGGLAEYGIYPVKDKMKFGLRKQFAKALALPNLHYFGHVPVGQHSAISIEALRELNPAAMLFAVGAQGTKKLGLPGEDAAGVYSAKDFVYFYNLLPPFASQNFSTGKRVAIVGMGNVMVDIVRWLLVDCPDRKPEEVIVIARRGPLEAKFDQKEFAYVETYLDRKAFQEELERVKDRLAVVGQDIAKVPEETFPCLVKNPDQPPVGARLKFRFLSSPVSITAGPDGRIVRLTVADNILLKRDEGTSAKTTDQTTDLDVDTLIFAIGDVHDHLVGLPCGPSGYLTNTGPHPQAGYEVFDPATGREIPGIFVVGWARKASEGLVGIARHDGEVGAAYVLHYLRGLESPPPSASPDEIAHFLGNKRVRAVSKSDLAVLGAVEEREAQARGVNYFKFSDNEVMLAAIEREKANSQKAAVPLAH